MVGLYDFVVYFHICLYLFRVQLWFLVISAQNLFFDIIRLHSLNPNLVRVKITRYNGMCSEPLILVFIVGVFDLCDVLQLVVYVQIRSVVEQLFEDGQSIISGQHFALASFVQCSLPLQKLQQVYFEYINDLIFARFRLDHLVAECLKGIMQCVVRARNIEFFVQKIVDFSYEEDDLLLLHADLRALLWSIWSLLT